MKSQEVTVGTIITSDKHTRDKVISVSARKIRIVQIDAAGKEITAPNSIWKGQINGLAGAARLFSARTNYSVITQTKA